MRDFIQQVIFGIANGALYALVAIGFALAYRTIRLLNFSHQQLVMFGGLAGYSVVTAYGLPLWVAVVAVTVGMALLSMLIEVLVIRPIRTRQGEPINMIIATLGLGVVMVETARLVWGGGALSYPRGIAGRQFIALGITFPVGTLITIGVALLAMAGLQLFLTRTWSGRGLRATAEHWRGAEIVGVNVNRTLTLTFGITGALAGLAGVLISWLYVATFTLGDIGVKALAGAVLGGFGSLPGAIIGGLVLGIGENLFAVYAVSRFTTIFVYTVLIGILLVYPRGLFGAKVTEAR